MDHTLLPPSKPLANAGWKWGLLLFFIAILSVGVRFYYNTHVVVFQPVDRPEARGDAVEYYNYAQNLLYHGVFSASRSTIGQPPSDSFRDPGYPVFLAFWLKIFPQWNSWYAAVLISQTVLGGLTVLLWLYLGRRLLPISWLAAAGTLMALWPHSVTITSDLLAETLYGFLVALSLAAFNATDHKRSAVWAFLCGACLSMAALTNAVFFPFVGVLILYGIFRLRMPPRLIFITAITFIGTISPWQVRNILLKNDQPTSVDRATVNFVQGSWPSYHAAYKAAINGEDPNAKLVMAKISREISLFHANRERGLSAMWQRFADSPWRYIEWYLQKPALLWGWSIRMGSGDIYVYATKNSPFSSSSSWRGIAAICYALNPAIMLLALTGCLASLIYPHQLRDTCITVLLLLLITLIHSVLQAEPRYSIPYRGAEILICVTALYRLATLTEKHMKSQLSQSN